MEFKNYLKEAALELDEELDKTLLKFLNEIKISNPKLIPYIIGLINACKGGKRVRGGLIKLGYELGENPKSEIRNPKLEEVVKVGVAYEIFHGSILAHDDIIDESPLRRGKPSLYKAIGGDHHAIAQTICIGDLGFFLSIKLISETRLGDFEKNKVINYFSKTMIDTALGEMLDVELPYLRGKGDPSASLRTRGGRGNMEQDVIKIMKLKTAQYTLSAPLIIGAMIAGSDNLIESLQKFGEGVGIAFQIQDDILGVFGTEEETGKSINSDIEEGKNTLLYTQALKNADDQQLKDLEKYYGKGSITEEGLETVRKIFLDTGALDYARDVALEYVDRAKKVIGEITEDAYYKSMLEGMADYLIERNK